MGEIAALQNSFLVGPQKRSHLYQMPCDFNFFSAMGSLSTYLLANLEGGLQDGSVLLSELPPNLKICPNLCHAFKYRNSRVHSWFQVLAVGLPEVASAWPCLLVLLRLWSMWTEFPASVPLCYRGWWFFN